MSLPFYIVNAFTKDLYAGNPAAIIFLDSPISSEKLQGLAANLNQPIACYILPPSGQESSNESAGVSDAYSIRWFATKMEVPLCGHGLLATAGTIFTIPGMVSPTVDKLTFTTAAGKTVSARKFGDRVQISLPATTVTPPSPDAQERLKAAIRRGLGSDSITIRYVGYGGEGFERYLMAEIDEEDDLAGCKPNCAAFLDTGYAVNVITSKSSKPDTTFMLRMFAPAAGIPEDHVCGTAHCLAGPYWAQKLELGGKEMASKQVSPRGGDLSVVWREDAGEITLTGAVVVSVKGELSH